jgi:hypothetical protein
MHWKEVSGMHAAGLLKIKKKKLIIVCIMCIEDDVERAVSYI